MDWSALDWWVRPSTRSICDWTARGFEFVALADISAIVRAALRERYGLQQLHADLSELLDCNLDAVVITAQLQGSLPEQLRAFHAAAYGQAPVSTSVEQARRDVELLISAFRKAAR